MLRFRRIGKGLLIPAPFPLGSWGAQVSSELHINCKTVLVVIELAFPVKPYRTILKKLFQGDFQHLAYLQVSLDRKFRTFPSNFRGGYFDRPASHKWRNYRQVFNYIIA